MAERVQRGAAEAIVMVDGSRLAVLVIVICTEGEEVVNWYVTLILRLSLWGLCAAAAARARQQCLVYPDDNHANLNSTRTCIRTRLVQPQVHNQPKPLLHRRMGINRLYVQRRRSCRFV